jgi:hypothetical protein
MPEECETKLKQWTDRFEEHRSWRAEDLALVPTSFDRFEPALCLALIYRGWWLTGANMTCYHSEIAFLPNDTQAPPI